MNFNIYVEKIFFSLRSFFIGEEKRVAFAKNRKLIQKKLFPAPLNIYELVFSSGVGDYFFNPTFLDVDDKYIFFFRYVNQKFERRLGSFIVKKNSLFPGSGFFKVKNWVVHDLDVSWAADPRIFKFRKKSYIVFNTGHSEVPNNMYLHEISDNGELVGGVIKLIKEGGRSNIEKNWGFFEFEENLFAIYSVSPFVVLNIEINSNGTAYARYYSSHEWDSKGIENNIGELRGGASPILIGDCYYYIIQSNIKSAIAPIYTSSIISFDKRPPFRPLKINIDPLFTLSEREYRYQPYSKLNSKIEACFYPSGAVYNKARNELSVSYGVNDHACFLRVYDFEDVKGCLCDIAF